jgi:hypothetical protein
LLGKTLSPRNTPITRNRRRETPLERGGPCPIALSLVRLGCRLGSALDALAFAGLRSDLPEEVDMKAAVWMLAACSVFISFSAPGRKLRGARKARKLP